MTSVREAAQPCVKGAAVRELARWLQTSLGQEESARVVGRVPPEERSGLDPHEFAFGILASRWYPVASVHALFDALLADPDCPAREQLTHEIGRHVVSQTLGGVYELLFRWMATPERYARYAAKLWRSYYDHGTFEVRELGEHASQTTISGWEGHHAFLCELNVVAAAVLYEKMGCKGVEVKRTECVGEGGRACSFRVTWSG